MNFILNTAVTVFAVMTILAMLYAIVALLKMIWSEIRLRKKW